MENKENIPSKVSWTSERKIYTGLILFFFIILFIQRCENNKLESLNFEQTKEINEKGELLVTQKQNILSLKDAVAQGLVEKEKYMKDIKAQTKVITKTILVNKVVPYHDTIERIVYVDSINGDTDVYVKLPIRVEYRDSWNFFKGTFGCCEFTIDSMVQSNELRLTIGHKKAGFLKKPIPVVEVKSSNPNADVTIASNAIIEEKEPFYRKFSFGMIAGAVIMILLL